MKTMWLLGLLSMLMVSYNLVASSPRAAAQGPDRPATLPGPVAIEGNAGIPEGFSEYVFLHHARHENVPVHAMAGVTTCSQ